MIGTFIIEQSDGQNSYMYRWNGIQMEQEQNGEVKSDFSIIEWGANCSFKLHPTKADTLWNVVINVNIENKGEDFYDQVSVAEGYEELEFRSRVIKVNEEVPKEKIEEIREAINKYNIKPQ